MQNIAAVILAAGGSSRFGSPKQLAEIDGETFVRRIVDAAREAGCSPTILVVGKNAEQVASGMDATIVKNESWQEGIGASIRAGIQYLAGINFTSEAVVLLACDQPFVNANTIRDLVALGATTGKEIVACRYAHTVGVPALFAGSVFPELIALEGDMGAKNILMANRDRVAELRFPEGEVDIDIPADYEAWKKSCALAKP